MSAKVIKFRCADHPEANGRTPKHGEQSYELVFPLETGQVLQIKFGQKGFDTVSQIMLDMMAETPSYGDGSLDHVRKELEE